MVDATPSSAVVKSTIATTVSSSVKPALEESLGRGVRDLFNVGVSAGVISPQLGSARRTQN
jgi:hypothetical protein